MTNSVCVNIMVHTDQGNFSDNVNNNNGTFIIIVIFFVIFSQFYTGNCIKLLGLGQCTCTVCVCLCLLQL
jgi:hypothetical protein